MGNRESEPSPIPPDQSKLGKNARHPTPLSLLEQVRAHDPAAWERLLRLYRPLVQFWCGKAGLHAEDAEDVAQEVFAAAATGLDLFRRDRPDDTFRGWLRVITRNQVALFFRRRQGQAVAEGGSDALWNLQGIADPLPGPGEDEEVEMNQLFRRAVEQVRDRFEAHTWQAFWLTVIQGRTPAHLTEELGMSVASIRQAKSRVLRLLKQELGELLA
jgi:RNA polymerase sigma-70 factor, ECF subfamily